MARNRRPGGAEMVQVQRHEPRIGEQHRDQQRGEQQIDRREEALSGEERADRLELAHPRHRLTGTARLEIEQRQAQQVIEQSCAQFDVDAVSRMLRSVVQQHGT
jgi:hypothetical protein